MKVSYCVTARNLPRFNAFRKLMLRKGVLASGIRSVTHSEQPFNQHMVVKSETWWLPGSWSPDDGTPMTAVYALDGSYVGDLEFAKYLSDQGIAPERATPELSVASVGFCAAQQKWAGWSHRALCMFGLGDKLFDENFAPFPSDVPFVQHGSTTITDLAQARTAAVNFANYVS